MSTAKSPDEALVQLVNALEPVDPEMLPETVCEAYTDALHTLKAQADGGRTAPGALKLLTELADCGGELKACALKLEQEHYGYWSINDQAIAADQDDDTDYRAALGHLESLRHLIDSAATSAINEDVRTALKGKRQQAENALRIGMGKDLGNRSKEQLKQLILKGNRAVVLIANQIDLVLEQCAAMRAIHDPRGASTKGGVR